MTKNELLALGITEEQAQKIMDDQGKNFVLKTRFNELNESKKALDTQLAERDTQLETLKKSAKDSEELQKQIADLQSANKTQKDGFEKQIQTMKIDNAVNSALTAAKARNPKAVRAMLEMDAYELDDNGQVKGLEDAIKKAKEANAWAFEPDKPDKQGNNGGIDISGFKPAESGDNKGGQQQTMESQIWNALNGK